MKTPYTELLEFLAGLPNLESVAERKALLAFSGYFHMGLYLDFSGSQINFAEALIELMSGRGQQFTHQFLAALKNTPQISTSNQDQIAELQSKFAALSLAEWEQTFPTVQPKPVDSTSLPDSDMLVLTIVSDLLLPFYTLGTEQLQAQSGDYAVDLAREVVDVLVGDARIRPLLNMFKAAPTATEAGFVAALKGIVAVDEDLARTLARILIAEREGETAVLSAFVQISQDIREVSGAVVGAVVGEDVVGKLSVKQKIDTVSAGGTLVGAVIGAPSDTRIGGQTVEGDYVAGDKVAGDKIEGDQIKTGDIVGSSGIALGRVASADVD